MCPTRGVAQGTASEARGWDGGGIILIERMLFKSPGPTWTFTYLTTPVYSHPAGVVTNGPRAGPLKDLTHLRPDRVILTSDNQRGNRQIDLFRDTCIWSCVSKARTCNHLRTAQVCLLTFKASITL